MAESDHLIHNKQQRNRLLRLESLWRDKQWPVAR